MDMEIVVSTNAGSNEEEPTPITAEKVYNYNNLKIGKLVINKPSVSVTINGDSKIKNGVVFRGEYAEFHGDGFQNTTITLEPKKAGAIIDFKATKLQKSSLTERMFLKSEALKMLRLLKQEWCK